MNTRGTGALMVMPDAEDERELVDRAIGGDIDALGELLQRHQARVFSLVKRLVDHEGEAEELTQEAFLQAFRSIRRFEPGRPFRPWLCGIAVNVCKNHRRGAARREVASDWRWDELRDATTSGSPEEQSVRAANVRELESALSALSPEDRALVLLRYQEGMSYEEIAASLGARPATLRVRCFRLMDRLRARLREVLQ